MDSKTYFSKILEILEEECREGKKHFAAWKGLLPADYSILTKEAHFESALMRLCRLMDKHPDSKGINKFLSFTGNHPMIFKKTFPDIIKKSVAEDKIGLNKMDKAIKNILGLRDKYLAHLDRKYFMHKEKVFTDYPVTPVEIENLYSAVSSILEKYRIFFYGNG